MGNGSLKMLPIPWANRGNNVLPAFHDGKAKR